jgi:type I restriction enzyme S subunit
MNAEFLLRHYERIADAPDAIGRLRTFVLDLAGRGKLLPQNKNELVAKEYAGEKPTETLPKNWRQLNFGKFCDIEGGNQPPKSQFVNEPKKGYVQLFQIRDLGEKPVPTYIPIGSTNRFCKEGEILIGRYGASVGKVFWAQNGAYNVAMAKFIWPADALIADFAFLLLKSKYLQGPLARVTRSAQAGFNKGDLSTINFPLPPLAEQHRIVAKVDELMELCDRLDAARAEREAARDRLTAASLARLNTPDPKHFQDHARFAINTLPALTTRPDQIKQLRQTILNLAVRGKLVAQDPKDEPASKCLKRVAKDKARSIREEKLNSDNLVFPSPSGWEWTTVQSLLTQGREISYGVIKLGDVPKVGGVPTLRCSDVKPGFIEMSGVRKVAEDIEAEYARTRLNGGEILINIRGTLGGVAKVPETLRGFNVAREVAVIPIEKEISAEFMVYVMLSQYFWEAIQENLRGIAYKGLNLGTLREFRVPVPPLAEQLRIVAELDELMSICNQLEQSLATTNATRRRLLEAILADALVPARIAELKSAE